MAIPEGGIPTGPVLASELGASLGGDAGADSAAEATADAGAADASAVGRPDSAAAADVDATGAYVKFGGFGAVAQAPSKHAEATRRAAL